MTETILEPGVYLDLSEDIYFAQDALGSSDLKNLLRAPADWWYSSRHNPHYTPPSDVKHRILGRALHALMLEGRQVYDTQFSIEPDPADYPGALRTTDEIKEFLGMCNVYFPSKAAKADLVRIMVENDYGARSWDHIKAEHDQAVQLFNRIPIKAAQDRALRHMAELADGAPTIGDALRRGISEVSVFWHRPELPGILFRARLDSVSPAFTLDLKSLSNWKGRTISDMARRQVEEFEYDIQRRFYDEARQMMRQFIVEDRIFLPDNAFIDGGEKGFYCGRDFLEPATVASLDAIAATESWVWIWLFFQMRDDVSGKAPILIPRIHLPHGEVWDEAGVKVEQAIENYQSFVKRFGLDTPWCHIEPALELDDADLAGLRYKTAV